MTTGELQALGARVQRLEDEATIRRLVLTYGPSVDSGESARAAQLWADDGVYDWDADGEPHSGSAAVEAMLNGEGHRGLIKQGVAHFAGPLLIQLDGDRAVALNYSLIMRRKGGRFYLWRVSAARWDLERRAGSWRVQRRTNRLLDESGAGRQLFGETLRDECMSVSP